MIVEFLLDLLEGVVTWLFDQLPTTDIPPASMAAAFTGGVAYLADFVSPVSYWFNAPLLIGTIGGAFLVHAAIDVFGVLAKIWSYIWSGSGD